MIRHDSEERLRLENSMVFSREIVPSDIENTILRSVLSDSENRERFSFLEEAVIGEFMRNNSPYLKVILKIAAISRSGKTRFRKGAERHFQRILTNLPNELRAGVLVNDQSDVMQVAELSGRINPNERPPYDMDRYVKIDEVGNSLMDLGMYIPERSLIIDETVPYTQGFLKNGSVIGKPRGSIEGAKMRIGNNIVYMIYYSTPQELRRLFSEEWETVRNTPKGKKQARMNELGIITTDTEEEIESYYNTSNQISLDAHVYEMTWVVYNQMIDGGDSEAGLIEDCEGRNIATYKWPELAERIKADAILVNRLQRYAARRMFKDLYGKNYYNDPRATTLENIQVPKGIPKGGSSGVLQANSLAMVIAEYACKQYSYGYKPWNERLRRGAEEYGLI